MSDIKERLRGFIGLKNTHSLGEYSAALNQAFDHITSLESQLAKSQELAGEGIQAEFKLRAQLAERDAQIAAYREVYHTAWHALDDSSEDETQVITIQYDDYVALNYAIECFEDAYPTLAHGYIAQPEPPESQG